MLRPNLMKRFALLAGTSAGLALVPGCNQHPLKSVEYQGEQEEEVVIDLTVNRDVDILFVIDNSGSMGNEQALLSQNFHNFIEVLEAPDVKANYRIAVTTTDSGNPECPGTTPEAGKFQMSSCRERLQDFVFDPGGQNEIDKRDEACLDVCERDGFEIEPSLAADGDKKRRKWLESQEGKTNIPDDWTTEEAFGCFGPQGINGCGFESQLESMYKSLRLTADSNSDAYSFMREGAILAIVIVTDELDCSYNPKHGDIFGDNKTFWFDPDVGPKSGICWDAGVECTGDGRPYDECHPADLDEDANEVDSDEAGSDAVLHPVSRYIDIIQTYENAKKIIDERQEVIVSVLGGVPQKFASGEEELLYFDPSDDADRIAFGVTPGCTSLAGGEAYPPVRMREWAKHFTTEHEGEEQPNMFSICNDDYSDALKAIADAITQQIRPACFGACAKDTDVQSSGLQVHCAVTEHIAASDIGEEVAECERDDDGSYTWKNDEYVLPDGSDACYAVLSDKGGSSKTDDEHDSMDATCVEGGMNLEFKLQRRKGVPAKPGTRVKATCKLSEVAEIDCPDLR